MRWWGCTAVAAAPRLGHCCVKERCRLDNRSVSRSVEPADSAAACVLLPFPLLSSQVPVDSDGGQASGERVSARQRNEWSQFDARWGREKELQHETDMEFFRATRDGTALPGTAAAAEEEDAGVGAAGGAMMIRGGGAAAAVAAVAALLRDGWAEPEVPLVAQPPPAAMQATPASASVHRL